MEGGGGERKGREREGEGKGSGTERVRGKETSELLPEVNMH